MRFKLLPRLPFDSLRSTPQERAGLSARKETPALCVMALSPLQLTQSPPECRLSKPRDDQFLSKMAHNDVGK